MSDKKITKPVNPQASEEVRRVLEYLGQISGKQIITGQHTQTTEQPELQYIQKVTGKLPALCGFELLGYSPNINYDDADEACLKEVRENIGTLDNALEWAKNQKGLITFTWHWFSPLGGRDKSFYAYNTDFNPVEALIPGTPENEALMLDMDFMADKLKTFRDLHIPILWRPFHEADGDWFWWGSKISREVSAKLFRLMYDRYTHFHGLNNLIWVWNSPKSYCYPGDDVVDIITMDLYPPKHTHLELKVEYEELTSITQVPKLAAIGEIGTLPDVEKLCEAHVPLCWYMTWSNDFCLGEEWNSNEQLIKTYSSKYVITLDNLPDLY